MMVEVDEPMSRCFINGSFREWAAPGAHLATPPVFTYFEDMEVNFTPEQEAQLAQIATKAGTDPAHLVKDAALRLLEDESYIRQLAPELPVWNLGAAGPMRRRDIYNDVP
jgi:hypothetical protein